jgi:hypothetical protein
MLLIIGFFTFWVIFTALIYSTSDQLNKSDLHPYVELEWNAKTGW